MVRFKKLVVLSLISSVLLISLVGCEDYEYYKAKKHNKKVLKEYNEQMKESNERLRLLEEYKQLQDKLGK